MDILWKSREVGDHARKSERQITRLSYSFGSILMSHISGILFGLRSPRILSQAWRLLKLDLLEGCSYRNHPGQKTIWGRNWNKNLAINPKDQGTNIKASKSKLSNQMKTRGWISNIGDRVYRNSPSWRMQLLLIEPMQHSARNGKALLTLTEAPTLMDFQWTELWQQTINTLFYEKQP